MGSGFPKRMRLRKRREYLSVQNHPSRRKVHGEHFLLIAAPRIETESVEERNQTTSKTMSARVGITVSKKVGNAVTRNRVKRLVRECVRLHPNLTPGGCDVVVIAKRRAAKVTGLAQVCSELMRLGGRLAPC